MKRRKRLTASVSLSDEKRRQSIYKFVFSLSHVPSRSSLPKGFCDVNFSFDGDDAAAGSNESAVHRDKFRSCIATLISGFCGCIYILQSRHSRILIFEQVSKCTKKKKKNKK